MLDMDKMVVITAAVFCGFLAYGMLQRERTGFCPRSHKGERHRVKATDQNKDHYPYSTYLKVEGMNCSKCARRVENALNSLPDTWAAVDLKEGRVMVRTKQPFQEEPVRQALDQAGYTLDSWETL